MIRLLPLILLAAACTPTLPAPALQPPGEWHEAALPSGVLARADLHTGSIEWDRRLLQHPPAIVAAVILHEVCHLRGHVTEYSADCCAAELFARLYGVESVPGVVLYWHDRSPPRVMPWLECGR